MASLPPLPRTPFSPFLSLLLTILLLLTPTHALSIPYEPNHHTYLPNTHFGHVFASNLTSPSGGCKYTSFPTDSSKTRWIVLSGAYGSHYCDKSVSITTGDRTAHLRVVDICPDCGAEDILISEERFAYLYEGDERLIRRGRKFGPRWWFEGEEGSETLEAHEL